MSVKCLRCQDTGTFLYVYGKCHENHWDWFTPVTYEVISEIRVCQCGARADTAQEPPVAPLKAKDTA